MFDVEYGLEVIMYLAMYMAPALNGLVLVVLTVFVALYLRRLTHSARRLAETHELLVMLAERHFETNTTSKPATSDRA